MTDPEYLTAHGWRLVTKHRSKYGWIQYWDHDQHRRRNGLWWTQSAAVAYQRRLKKREKRLT